MRKPILIGIVLTVVAVLAVLALVMLARIGASRRTAEAQQTSNVPQHLQITNPDYVANPSAYLVDYDEKVSSILPLGRGLWVEEVVNPYTIKVSYVVDQAGSHIIDFRDINIPGLGLPGLPDDKSFILYETTWAGMPEGKCWTEGAMSFVALNLLHKPVYLASEDKPRTPYLTNESKRLLMETLGSKDTRDVAEFVISNGYGTVPFNSSRDYDYSHPNEYELHSMQEVASLANRGLWGTCGSL